MNDYDSQNHRLIIVSNRLPVVLNKSEAGEWQIESGSGGLVTAMAPVLRDRGGIWIGWPGNVTEEEIDTDSLLKKETKKIGYTLKAINLSETEKEDYYKGFANEIIWPLFHDFPSHCVFRPRYWKIYREVNRGFAEVIAENISPNDFIWIHDYHLIHVGMELRKMGVKNRIAYFLHIPFPPPDIFVRLPWRFEVLNALAEYDLLGFQTIRDRRNFIQNVRRFLHSTRANGKGQVVTLKIAQRDIRVGAFPISIDYREFAKLAGTQEVTDKAWYIHEDFPEQKLIFGVDRLDYSKGIPERLKAFRTALQKYPELRRKVTFIQLVVPSRRDIAKYADLKIEIEGLVGEINGEFSESGWVPIHYFFRSLERPELVAYYRTSEIAFITPLKDGMNLVAKEYCASNLEENGVLILSEFAGAAPQFQKNAILVNPHDIEGMAKGVKDAFSMPENERKRRMRKLRREVKRRDIFWWVDSFLEAAFARHLDNFPVIEDYIPTE